MNDGWILNEAAVSKYGLTDKPLEAIIMDLPVVAIIKDFNYTSLHSKIEPFAFRYLPNHQNGGYAIVRINSLDSKLVKITLDFIQKEWKEFVPGVPFEFEYFEDKFEKMYKKEKQLKLMIIYFSIIAILIACLGLFS